ncbi:MAG: hypothetical protein CK551_05965, partial [Planctomycetaceae bacterium]
MIFYQGILTDKYSYNKYLMSEMDEALVEFLIECQENLSRMDLELLQLEKSTDPELVKSIFR